MCVIVRNPEIKVSDEAGRKYYQEVLSYQQKGIDGERVIYVPLLPRSAAHPRRPAASPRRLALWCVKRPSFPLPARVSSGESAHLLMCAGRHLSIGKEAAVLGNI